MRRARKPAGGNTGKVAERGAALRVAAAIGVLTTLMAAGAPVGEADDGGFTGLMNAMRLAGPWL